MPRDQFVGIRMTRAGTEHIDQRAERAGVTRSEMIRRMLAYAAAKMPEGWTPK
jgi:Ribbon-helix-helix protein, copG family